MFTENQVRQFYVVNGTDSNVKNTSAVGTIQIAATGTATISADVDEFYFIYKGPSEDGVQRTDLIKKCNIMDIRATDAQDLVHKTKKVVVALDENVNGGAPILGQDYILNVDIHGYIAPDYNSLKGKFGATRAANTVASDLYKALAVSLVKNMSREPVKLVKVYLATAVTKDAKGNITEVTVSDEVTGKKTQTLGGTYVGIVIEEAEQPWRRGAAPQEFVNFEVNPSTVYVSGLNDDFVWGSVEMVDDGSSITNSKTVADMEWFFHKERGDRYGELCWPINIDTEYQVTPSHPSWNTGFSFLDIHFYYEGNSHNVGHSEKTLTLVGTTSVLKTLLSSIETICEGVPVKIVKSASWDGE